MSMPALAQQTIQVSTFNSPFSAVMREVMLEAYRRAEISVQVTHYPGNRALKMSSTGAADAELYRIGAINKIYPDLIKIPVPLYFFEIRAFSKNFDFKPDGWKSLQDYKVGVLNGVKVTEKNTEGMQRESVNNLQHMFALLESERIDLALTTNVAGNITMNELNFKHIKMLTPPVYSFPVFHFVHKSNSQLVPIISTTLTEMSNQGIINRIITTELEKIYNGIETVSSP
jgi:polar amino acid transport system substrate-binding protein